MCDFKQLYCGSDGYIIQCRHCNYYQIGFSSVMLTLNENDFQVLCQDAAIASCRYVDYEDENIKQIVLHTPYSGVNILLSIQELKSFVQMLDIANTESVSLALMELFDKN